MTTNPENPPAFPIAWPAPNAPEPGMTLRDYFAAAVAPGVIRMLSEQPSDEVAARAVAERSYLIADAMLKARAA